MDKYTHQRRTIGGKSTDSGIIVEGDDIDSQLSRGFSNNTTGASPERDISKNISNIIDSDTDKLQLLCSDDKRFLSRLLARRVNNSLKDGNGRTAPHRAVSGDTSLALLLGNKANIHYQDESGRTALHDAVAEGRYSATKLLLESGADVSCKDNNGRTALHEAVSRSDCAIFEPLNGHTVAHKAAKEDSCASQLLRDRVETAPADSISNQISIIKLLLNSRANVSCQDRNGRTALHDAASGGYDRVVQLLLENGAKASCQDHNGRTALHDAASRGYDRVVRILLHNWADVSCQDQNGRTALHDAAAGGYGGLVQLLLNKSAKASCQDRNGRTALHDAASGGCDRVVQLLLEYGADAACQDSNGHTALHDAAAGGYDSVVQLLLDNGADASCQDRNGRTALHNAAAAGTSYSIVPELIENDGIPYQESYDQAARKSGPICFPEQSKGALKIQESVDLQVCCLRHSNRYDVGALKSLQEVRGQYYFIISLLLKNGADVSCKDSTGRTALHDAAAEGRYSIVALLHENGAYISCQDYNKLTPLHYAANTGKFEMITGLVRLGADILLQDKHMRTPMDIAESRGYQEIIRFLEEEKEKTRIVGVKKTTLNPLGKLELTTQTGIISDDRDTNTTIKDDHDGIKADLGDDTICHNHSSHPDTHSDSPKPGDTSTYEEDTGELGGNIKEDISPKVPRPHTPKNQPESGDQSDNKPPEPTTQSDTSSGTLSGDSAPATPWPSTGNTILAYEDEDELESGDDEMETVSEGDSNYSSEVFSCTKNTGNFRSCGDGGRREGKGKEKLTRKRSSSQKSTENSGTGSQEDEASGRPNKKRKKSEEGQNKSPSEPKRPLACPYHKNDPLNNPECAKWRNPKLDAVKSHCKSHLGVQCHRCKIFRASTQEKINQHLHSDDCEKPTTYDPSEEEKIQQKADDIKKLKTWERIYETLFPLYIPDPYWQEEIEVLMTSIDHRDESGPKSNEYDTAVHNPLSEPPEGQQSSVQRSLHEPLALQYEGQQLLPEVIGGDLEDQNHNQNTTTGSFSTLLHGFEQPIDFQILDQDPSYSQAGPWDSSWADPESFSEETLFNSPPLQDSCTPENTALSERFIETSQEP